MNKPLLFLLILLTSILCSSRILVAQNVHDAKPIDSAEYTFELTDSLNHELGAFKTFIDTSGTTLWAIGTTNKPIFSSGSGNTRAIMTDSVNSYPVNADDAFTLTITDYHFNMTVSFWHKYETTQYHDGGIVEYRYSTDSLWQDVMGPCNTGTTFNQGIITDNFYNDTNTIVNGLIGFNGTSAGWQYSRIQFFWGLPVKTTGGGPGCLPKDTTYLRFRFVSDDTLENLDGWIIDNIVIERDDWTGSVGNISVSGLKVYPNPSPDGIINFPAFYRDNEYNLEVLDMTGRSVLETAYKQRIDLRHLPGGVYMYKVTNGEQIYTGRILLE